MRDDKHYSHYSGTSYNLLPREGGGWGFWLCHDKIKQIAPPPSVKALQYSYDPHSLAVLKLTVNFYSSPPLNSVGDNWFPLLSPWKSFDPLKLLHTPPPPPWWMIVNDSWSLRRSKNKNKDLVPHLRPFDIVVRCLINLSIKRFNIFMHCIQCFLVIYIR